MLNESYREKISHTAIVAAVVGAAYVAFSVHAPTTAADSAKAAGDKAPVEQCFGVAKADYNGQSFMAVPAGTCMTMGGNLAPFEGKNPKKPG
jgi:uncharacterized membrane protein